MKISGLRILVLDGAGRQILPVLSGLYDLRCHITTLNFSKLDIGYASKYPKNKLLYKGIGHNLEKIKTIVDKEIKSGKYDIIIPLGDRMTEFLARNWLEYSAYIRSFIPSYETFMKAFDKQQTMEICQRIGISCTRTKMSSESMDSFLNRVGGYPIVAKPRSGFGSVGFHCIKSEKEFARLLTLGEINFNEFVIQEYVDQNGEQYNVHAFMDQKDEIAYIVPTQKCRWFPVDGGSSCFCRTIDRPDLIEQCTRLLKAIHWRGCCEIELIQDPSSGVAKVMEINGRTSACVKISQLFGVNIAKSMVELALGRNVTKQMPAFKDVRMRCIHTDLLWFLKSPNRFTTEPSWFNNKHTHDQIFTISDPWPFVTFSLQSVLKFRSEMKKRSR